MNDRNPDGSHTLYTHDASTGALLTETDYATGGKIVAESANNYIEFYQKDSNIRVTGFDSQQANYNAPTTNSAVWANIVDANALGLVKGATVANGDIVLETALGAALHKDGALSEIATDLQVAKDYETYLANSDAIDTLIAANPDSSFTAGWTLTLLRAKELGLNLLTVQSGWDRDALRRQREGLRCQRHARGRADLQRHWRPHFITTTSAPSAPATASFKSPMGRL